MGLFGGKKQTALKTPTEFRGDVLQDFVTSATKKRYLNGSMPFVPEVAVAGEDFILGWLKNDAFMQRFNGVALTCYFNIAVFGFFGGAYYAHMWHHDFAAFQSTDLAGKLFRGGVQVTASPVMSIKRQEAESFCTELFQVFVKMLQPYNSLTDNRHYILNGLSAFFTLGASIQLKSMGFD